MNRLLFFLLLTGLNVPVAAQHIEAINEDSTKRVVFDVGKLVECVTKVNLTEIPIRGYIRVIDTTEFRIETRRGQFSTVQLASVLRMRRVSRRYVRNLAAAGSAPLAYNAPLMPTGQITSPGQVLTAAVVGVGIAGLRGDLNGPGRGPSVYQGWLFRVRYL